MNKIPTIFLRDMDAPKYVTEQPNPECLWVFDGWGTPTRKYDGICVRITTGVNTVAADVRRIVKPGKTPPAGFTAISIDPNTGNTVGWEPAEQSGFARWVQEGIETALDARIDLPAGTYELVGPKINQNPERFAHHELIPHGASEVLGLPEDLTHAAMAAYFQRPGWPDWWEGVVWHHPDGVRMAKIKRRDFA